MRVLAIAAHPGDIEKECAGTLIRCVKRGDEVFACHLSDGSSVSQNGCKNAKEAGKIAGYNVIYGGFHDYEIFSESVEARNKVSDIIREVKPDFIITHSINDYSPDRTETSKLVFDASFSASVPHYPSAIEKACDVVPIFYMPTEACVNFDAKFHVDITEEFETKKRALLCFDGNKDELESGIAISGHFFAKQCGAIFAEGFFQHNTSLKLRPKRLLP